MPNLHEITATPQPSPCRFKADANLHGNGAAPQPSPCKNPPDANLHGRGAASQSSPCKNQPRRPAWAVVWWRSYPRRR